MIKRAPFNSSVPLKTPPSERASDDLTLGISVQRSNKHSRATCIVYMHDERGNGEDKEVKHEMRNLVRGHADVSMT